MRHFPEHLDILQCASHRILNLGFPEQWGGLFRTFWNSDLGFTHQNVLEQWVQ